MSGLQLQPASSHTELSSHTGVPQGHFNQSQVLIQGKGGIDQLELSTQVLCHDAEQAQI